MREHFSVKRADLGVLRRPAFRGLLVARAISLLGSSVMTVVVAFAVLDLPGGTAFHSGLIGGALTLGSVSFMLVGGVWGDRAPRNRVLAVGEFVAAIGSGSLGLLFWGDQLLVVPMVVAAFVQGAGSGIFLPAMSGMVADAVDRTEIQSANATLRVVANAMKVGGRALAGPIYALFGGGPSLLINSASSVLAGFMLLKIASTEFLPSTTSPLHDLRQGLKAFLARPWVVATTLSAVVQNVFIVSFTGVAGPALMKESGTGVVAWSIYMAMNTLGAIIGALWSARMRAGRQLALSLWLSLTLVVPGAALLFNLSMPIVIAAFLVWGIGTSAASALWELAMQTHIPREMLSRVMSVDLVLGYLALPVAFVATGAVVNTLGVRTTLIGLVTLTALACLAPGLLRSVRELVTDAREPLAQTAS